MRPVRAGVSFVMPLGGQLWLELIVTPGPLVVVLASVLGLASLCSAQTRQVSPRFVEMVSRTGVSFAHRSSHTSEKYLIEAMGAGVALLDFDSDGLLDIYFTNGAKIEDPMAAAAKPDKSDPRYWNRLYQNKGAWRFEDVTEQAGVAGRGYGMGVATGDYDNDGEPDLYITNFGHDILYRNNGDGTFSDRTAPAGLSGTGWSTGAAFLDYDRDGRLDLFVAHYLDWDFAKNVPCGDGLPERPSFCHPRRFAPIEHLLFRNVGEGKFADISDSTGISAHAGKGLGVALGDYDGDGWVDIFVANDSYPQQLFRNVGGKRFAEVGVAAGVAHDADGREFAGMGIAFADYDNDMQPDLFVNALARQSYWLFRNQVGSFSSVTAKSGLGGITDLHSGWGAGLVDFDNDGWRDLFVAQGHVMDDIELSDPSLAYEEPLLLAKNAFGRFFDVSKSAGEAFHTPHAARGAAFGDLDNDGRVDVVVSVRDGKAIVLRNVTETDHHWLTLNLLGGNTSGATVRIQTEGGPKFAIAGSAGSYLSASDPRVHFGLGDETEVPRIEITWPDGHRQVLRNVEIDQILDVRREPEDRR
jgi:hypothetical protein